MQGGGGGGRDGDRGDKLGQLFTITKKEVKCSLSQLSGVVHLIFSSFLCICFQEIFIEPLAYARQALCEVLRIK